MVRISDPATSACVRVCKGHVQGVTAVLCVGEGRLVSASLDGTICVFDGESGTCVQTLREEDVAAYTFLGALSDGCLLSCGKASLEVDCPANLVRIWRQ